MGAAAPRAQWWQGRRVLVTGHTGFVGGWLCAWLVKLGARVSGFALPPSTTPSFFALTGIESRLAASTLADLRDREALRRAVDAADPQVVLHLAAQPVVREAFRDPVATFATNVMGTVHLLEACRERATLERLVVYTTDKVYRNDQSGRPFVETDCLGGNEPYSASKAGADWAAAAYWESYLRRSPTRPGLVIVRAGNIIGGGDWTSERLLPDAMRAFSAGQSVVIRSPGATRPWQHVLDALRGTLVLAERAADTAEVAAALAWNLGPPDGEVHSVAAVVAAAAKAWGEGASSRHQADASIPESRALALSSAKAARELGWRCVWGLERGVAASVAWYRAAYEKHADLLELTARQIDEHLADVARQRA